MLTINDMHQSIARSHAELIRAQIALCDAQTFLKKHLPGGGQVQIGLWRKASGSRSCPGVSPLTGLDETMLPA